MKKTLYLLCALSIVFTSGCDWWKKEEVKMETSEVGVKKITFEALQKRMIEEKNIAIINVLSKEAYDACHIKGSVSMPTTELVKKAKAWDKNKKIILYCANYACQASTIAYKKLKAMGFTNIMDYKGGIKEWKDQKLPVGGKCATEKTVEKKEK